MANVSTMLGAANKQQFLDSLQDDKLSMLYEGYFGAFEKIEKDMEKELFLFTADEFEVALEMSSAAPSSIYTATRLLNFVKRYWSWAKEQGLVKASKSPFRHLEARHLCSQWAVMNRYPKSIEDLYERLNSRAPINNDDAKWAYMCLALLLLYEGADDSQFDKLLYRDVDFEKKVLTFDGCEYPLSDITLNLIETIHGFYRVNCRPVGKPLYDFIDDRSYVFPYGTKGHIFPDVGKHLALRLSRRKRKHKDQMEFDEWFAIESVKMAGDFYRTYTGRQPNTFSYFEEPIYQLWLQAYYPED